MTGLYLHPAPLPTGEPHSPGRQSGADARPARSRRPVPGGPSAPGGRPDDDAQHARAIGWEIVRLRNLAGLTQDQLAARSGVSVTTVRRWEAGTAVLVNLNQLRALAAVLGVSAGHLIDAGSATGGPGSRPTGTRPQPAHDARSGYVLLPTRLAHTRRAATAWRLLHYPPYELGQRWEHPHDTDPTRTVSPAVLDWATDLLGERTTLYGSASELTGARSWYVGPLTTPAPDTTVRKPHRAGTGGGADGQR